MRKIDIFFTKTQLEYLETKSYLSLNKSTAVRECVDWGINRPSLWLDQYKLDEGVTDKRRKSTDTLERQLTIRLLDAQYERIEALANIRKTTVSEAIRYCIEQYRVAHTGDEN